MTTVLLCRDGSAARYLAHRLALEGLVQAIILEHGAAARRRKLARWFAQSAWWQLPQRCLDLLALQRYGRAVDAHLTRQLLQPQGCAAYPAGVPQHTVDDANDPACIALLASIAPQIVVVFGTSILRDSVLHLPVPYRLNVHMGMVPHYRNVHSDAWAFLRRDYERIGTSILHLSAGIDDGDVALQAAIDVEPGDTILAIKRKNLEVAGRLVVQAVRLAGDHALPRTPQAGAGAGVYKTPGFAELRQIMQASVELPTNRARQP